MSALSLVGLLAAAAYEVWPHRAEVIADVSATFTPPARAQITPAATSERARPVYRHSIVPGGAYSRDEVAGAVRTDAVVAAHYEDVDVDRVRAKKVDTARAVYVSYRMGNQVYWTKNRVRLSPGETVLTDGDTEIRARCGNLLSDTAQQPVAAEEPPLAALDEAEPDTGSSTIAGARGPDGALAHVPFLAGPNGAGGVAIGAQNPTPGAPAPGGPTWFNGGGGGSVPPFVGTGTGTNGTSLVAPLGGGERTNSPNGGGSNAGGSNGGGSNGGGSNGGGPNGDDPDGDYPDGDGPDGGGPELPPIFVPPTTTGGVFTTTGGTVTTTGSPVIETTGGGDTNDDPHTVPEPATLLLFGLGACGLAARALRRR